MVNGEPTEVVVNESRQTRRVLIQPQDIEGLNINRLTEALYTSEELVECLDCIVLLNRGTPQNPDIIQINTQYLDESASLNSTEAMADQKPWDPFNETDF